VRLLPLALAIRGWRHGVVAKEVVDGIVHLEAAYRDACSTQSIMSARVLE
jgi:hypothetical protein